MLVNYFIQCVIMYYRKRENVTMQFQPLWERFGQCSAEEWIEMFCHNGNVQVVENKILCCFHYE